MASLGFTTFCPEILADSAAECETYGSGVPIAVYRADVGAMDSLRQGGACDIVRVQPWMYGYAPAPGSYKPYVIAYSTFREIALSGLKLWHVLGMEVMHPECYTANAIAWTIDGTNPPGWQWAQETGISLGMTRAEWAANTGGKRVTWLNNNWQWGRPPLAVCPAIATAMTSMRQWRDSVWTGAGRSVSDIEQCFHNEPEAAGGPGYSSAPTSWGQTSGTNSGVACENFHAIAQIVVPSVSWGSARLWSPAITASDPNWEWRTVVDNLQTESATYSYLSQFAGWCMTMYPAVSASSPDSVTFARLHQTQVQERVARMRSKSLFSGKVFAVAEYGDRNLTFPAQLVTHRGFDYRYGKETLSRIKRTFRGLSEVEYAFQFAFRGGNDSENIAYGSGDYTPALKGLGDAFGRTFSDAPYGSWAQSTTGTTTTTPNTDPLG